MEQIIDPTWSTEQVMNAYPKTVAVFVALKMNCAGCPLERFCTLAEAAASYGLPLAVLLEKLAGSIQFPNEE